MAMRQTSVGDVRSVFALAAEGKSQQDIAETMDMNISVVSRILRRVTHDHVKIPIQVLDKVAASGVIRNMKRKKVKKPTPCAPDTMKNPTMPAAVAKASVESDTRNTDTPPPPPARPAVVFNDEDGEYKLHSPTGGKPTHEEAIDEAHSKVTQPVKLAKKTKAQALMNVLASVQLCNEMRQQAAELRIEAVRLEAKAKSEEDCTFERLAAMTKYGFTPEFLSSLLSESGLCSDGRFDVK